ncbi:MAG: hypothetical protein ACKVQB_13330, partial [Bacteroidia bacterium]
VVMYFLLGLPLFILGFILHFLPFYFTNFIRKAVVKRTEFIGSVTLVVGLLLFALNGFTLTWLSFRLFDSILIAGLFFFLLPAIGIFTFKYYVRIRRWSYVIRKKSIGKRKAGLMEKLKEEKEALLEDFKLAHEDYLEYERRK